MKFGLVIRTADQYLFPSVRPYSGRHSPRGGRSGGPEVPAPSRIQRTRGPTAASRSPFHRRGLIYRGWFFGDREEIGAVTNDLKVLTTAPGFAQPLINLATIVGHTPTGSELTDHDTDSVAVLAPPKELTPPPTSTITPQTGTSNPGFALILLLLGVAGLTVGIGFITPAPARVRRRDRLG